MDDLGPGGRGAGGQVRRPIRSIGRIGAFVDDVGFALLLPTAEAALPSLYEAASQQPLPRSEMVWGPDAQPGLLVDWYPRVGERDDFRQAPLGEEARRVAETLLASGPPPAAVLREAVGLEGRRGGACFSAVVVELGRALVCISFGPSRSVPAGRARCWS